MKYALLDNNEIKVGPRDYHYGFFSSYLKGVDITVSDLPWNYSGSDAIAITDSVLIVPVQDIIQPTYNPITEQLAGPYWDVNTTLITGTYSVVDIDINVAQNKIKEYIANIRRQKEQSSISVVVQNQEVQISTSREDRNVWQQALSWMSDSDTMNFKFSDTVWLVLSRSDVIQINNNIHSAVEHAFNWEKDQVDQVNTIMTKEGLEAKYKELVDISKPVV